MDNQIYFKRPQKPDVAVTLAPHRWGPNGHIVIASADHRVWFSLSGNIGTLVIHLRAAAKRLEEMICTEAERGIVKGEVEEKPEEFNLITADDLNGDPAHDWQLITTRFPDLADCVPNYAKTNGNGHKPVDQLDLDLEMVAGQELLDEDGKPIYGAQSRVAEALGITNGGSHRKRIKAVLEAL